MVEGEGELRPTILHRLELHSPTNIAEHSAHPKAAVVDQEGDATTVHVLGAHPRVTAASLLIECGVHLSDASDPFDGLTFEERDLDFLHRRPHSSICFESAISGQTRSTGASIRMESRT